MIDPGNPFSAAYADVIAALEDRLRHGTEQPATYHLVFRAGVLSYELPEGATAITSVAGTIGSVYTIFAAGDDYQFLGNRLTWVSGARQPSNLSRVDVEYTYRERQSGLTDFNEGSVVGTLVRTVAREMTTIYAQMDQAYRRAFIDTASGVALDNVVALLGVARIPTLKARGPVTFLRQSPTSSDVTIPANTRVADQQGRIFLTLTDAKITPILEEVVRPDSAGTVVTSARIAAVLGVWPGSPTSPPPPLLALVADATHPFGVDERTLKLAATYPPTTGDVRIRYAPKSVAVDVEATVPGPEGNVNAGTVIVMPTPPNGITGVVNEKAIVGGRIAEADVSLRERAKHALERAGNATIDALRFAVLGVEGVDGAEVVDYEKDSSLPLGEVRLRYSGADRPDVHARVDAVIEQTRAAGVRVTRVAIQTIAVSGRFVLIPAAEPVPGADAAFRAAVVRTMLQLGVGAPLHLRQLNALAFGVAGLADVAEAQLTLADGTPVSDPLVVDSGHVVRADETNLKTMLLQRIDVAAPALAPGSPLSGPHKVTELSLQLRDAQGNALQPQGTVALDVTVEISASLTTSPTRPPEPVGRGTKTITFTGSPDAKLQLSLAAGDAPTFRSGDHAPHVSVKISASAYPGLQPATTSFDLL